MMPYIEKSPASIVFTVLSRLNLVKYDLSSTRICRISWLSNLALIGESVFSFLTGGNLTSYQLAGLWLDTGPLGGRSTKQWCKQEPRDAATAANLGKLANHLTLRVHMDRMNHICLIACCTGHRGTRHPRHTLIILLSNFTPKSHLHWIHYSAVIPSRKQFAAML